MGVKRKNSPGGVLALLAKYAERQAYLKHTRPPSNRSDSRTGFKRSNSRTRTKVVTKRRRRPVGRGSGKNGEYSLFKYVSPMSKNTRAAVAGCQVQSIQVDEAKIFHSGIGLQSASVWAIFGSSAAFNAVNSNFLTNFGNPLTAAQTVDFHITSEMNDSSWSNPGTMPLDVTFYTLALKKDTLYDPINAWSDGQVQEGDPTTPTVPVQNYRAVPDRSKMFAEHYKILCRKRVTLQPGEIHKRKVIWMKPKAINSQAFLLNNVVSATFLRGYSLVEMLVLHGYPAPLNTGTIVAPVASTTVATISPATIVCGIRRTIGYKFNNPIIKTFTTSNALQLTGNVTNETELTLKVEADE